MKMLAGPDVAQMFKLLKFGLSRTDRIFGILVYLLKVSSGNMLKFNNKDTRMTWRCSGVFIVNFEQVLHVVLMFPLLNLNK